MASHAILRLAVRSGGARDIAARTVATSMVALGLLASSPVLAQSAPTTINSTQPASASSFTITFTGDCPKNAVAILFAFNFTNRTWGASTLTDSVGNTWTPRSEAVQAGAHLRSYTSTLSAGAIVSGSTTLGGITQSGNAGPLFQAECYSSGTGIDSTGIDNGASSSFSNLVTTAGPPTNAVQMALVIFASNRWPNMTPQPPTGWSTGGTNLVSPGSTFGLKDYYANVPASSTLTATLTGLSSTTWVAAWVGIVTGRPQLLTLGVGQ